MTEDQKIAYIKWLCAECYGKYFISGMIGGMTSDAKISVSRTTDLSVTVGGQKISLIRRSYTKSSTYLMEFLNVHGVAPDGPVDTVYQSYFDATCWGEKHQAYSGEYSMNNEYENSTICYADLRNNIIVYYNETGKNGTKAAGSAPIGRVLAYAAFDGSETPGCKGVNALDAIRLNLNVTYNTTNKEVITLGSYTPYNDSSSSNLQKAVAASDRSGYCGGVSFECYPWGGYSVVKTCDPTEPELISPESLEAFRNTWDTYGTLDAMDRYDEELFYAAWFNSTGHVEPGLYDYPSFVAIDVLPHGSWMVDAGGNYFHSMITYDSKKFDRLNNDNPAKYLALSLSGVTYKG
jgi:hypothetical protein